MLGQNESSYIFKTSLMAFCYCLSLLSPLQAQSVDSMGAKLLGFRNFLWGTAPIEIKSQETSQLLQSSTEYGIYYLTYEGKIENLNVIIDYVFKENKLKAGSYTLSPADSFKSDFMRLERFIAAQYGNPNSQAFADINSDSLWIKQNEYGLFTGPQLHWKFDDGYIILHSSKAGQKITITVLFLNYTKFRDYLDDITPSLE